MPVTLCGFGAFPPRVIYVDVVREGSLMTIQPALMDYLAETLGIVDKNSRSRRFAPHMTVAFPATLNRPPFAGPGPEFKERAFFGEFLAKNLTLLKHDGQKWQVFSEFPFSPE